MNEITRGQLGDLLSAKMSTRTSHALYVQESMEITDDWIVVFLETDENGIMNIFCEAPAKK